MAKALEYVGHAPNGARCDCERDGCHAGNCGREGFAIVRAFGMAQTLCAHCLRVTREALAPEARP